MVPRAYQKKLAGYAPGGVFLLTYRMVRKWTKGSRDTFYRCDNIVWLLNFISDMFISIYVFSITKEYWTLVFMRDTSSYDKGCSRKLSRNSLEVSKATTTLTKPQGNNLSLETK